MSRRDDYDRDDEPRPPQKSGGGSGLLIGLLVGAAALVLCVCGGGGLAVYFGYQRIGSASERMMASNNLKQLGLAMHNYESTTGHLPTVDGRGRDGKPTLSWRVHLLPYIEEDILYRQFKLDEPWGSPHNRQVLDRYPMPSTFAYGRPRPDQKTTPFRVFLGGGAAFERGKITSFGGIERDNRIGFMDGSSNTFLIVEAADEVIWTKPDELEYSPTAPLPKLGHPSRNGFIAAMADGSVRFVSGSTKEATLRGVITRNGGEVIGPDF